MRRRRSEPHTFEHRLEAQKLRLERELSGLPEGRQRDIILARIGQLQTAAEMYGFLKSRERPLPCDVPRMLRGTCPERSLLHRG